MTYLIYFIYDKYIRKQQRKLKGAHVLKPGRIVNKKGQIVYHLFDVGTTEQTIQKDNPFKNKTSKIFKRSSMENK